MAKRKNKEMPKFILNFCKTISNKKPILVPLLPVVSEPINECFTAVPKHIIRYGGKQRIGWRIHIWRKVLIEAEFHSVWESPEGKIIDITPKINKINFIIFLPDTTKCYTGIQVNNIRESLSVDKNVTKHSKLWDKFFLHTNDGNLANYHGKIPLKGMISETYNLIVKSERNLVRKFGNDRGMPHGCRFVK